MQFSCIQTTFSSSCSTSSSRGSVDWRGCKITRDSFFSDNVTCRKTLCTCFYWLSKGHYQNVWLVLQLNYILKVCYDADLLNFISFNLDVLLTSCFKYNLLPDRNDGMWSNKQIKHKDHWSTAQKANTVQKHHTATVQKDHLVGTSLIWEHWLTQKHSRQPS